MSVELISVLIAVPAVGATLGGGDPDWQSRVAAGYARGPRSVARGHQRLAGQTGHRKGTECRRSSYGQWNRRAAHVRPLLLRTSMPPKRNNN